MLRALLFTTLLMASLPLMAKPLVIYTVNYPLKYFAERIGGEHVEVHLPVPADEDPAFWQPDTGLIQKYQQADLILLNGANYAKWTRHASLPLMRKVNTSRSFSGKYIMDEGGASHSHGSGEEHAHSGMAFTTWLDFNQAIAQASAIEKALVRKQPGNKLAFEQNWQALEQDLRSLDAAMREASAVIGHQPLIASHPVYQYLARAYNLNLKSVMWEPGVLPEEIQWQALDEMRTKHQAQWMIWEGEPLKESIERLESLGIKGLVFKPLANQPESGDFMSIMQANIEGLKLIKRTDPLMTLCEDPRPEMCTMQYDPVCGQLDDVTYKTYSNACSACSDRKVIRYRPGECE